MQITFLRLHSCLFLPVGTWVVRRDPARNRSDEPAHCARGASFTHQKPSGKTCLHWWEGPLPAPHLQPTDRERQRSHLEMILETIQIQLPPPLSHFPDGRLREVTGGPRW